MESALRILVVCGIKGKFTKLKGIASKVGPVNAVFCIGETLSIDSVELKEFSENRGDMLHSIPIYFICNGSSIGPFMHLYPKGLQIAPNIHFLGRYGVVPLNGLKVAFISGTDISGHIKNDKPVQNYPMVYTGNNFVQNDINNFCAEAANENIDLLLTCAMPSRLEKKVTLSLEDQKFYEGLSYKIQQLVESISPAYTICNGANKCFTRPALVNEKGGLTKIIVLQEINETENYTKSIFVGEFKETTGLKEIPTHGLDNPFISEDEYNKALRSVITGTVLLKEKNCEAILTQYPILEPHFVVKEVESTMSISSKNVKETSRAVFSTESAQEVEVISNKLIKIITKKIGISYVKFMQYRKGQAGFIVEVLGFPEKSAKILYKCLDETAIRYREYISKQISFPSFAELPEIADNFFYIEAGGEYPFREVFLMKTGKALPADFGRKLICGVVGYERRTELSRSKISEAEYGYIHAVFKDFLNKDNS